MARNTARFIVLLVAIMTTLGFVGPAIPGVPSNYSPVGVASAATQINACTTISTPGTYELNQSISNSGQTTCILINSSHVVLDGKGHTVDGMDSTGSAGIRIENASSTLENVTVRNVRVTDWDRAIYANDIRVSLIHDNVLTDNIQASTLGKLTVIDGTGVTVQRNIASHNEGFGIVVIGVENVVEENLAINNSGGFMNGTGGGIAVAGSHSRITSNRVFRNERVGLELESLHNSTVRRNIAKDNGDLGPGFPRYGFNGGIVFLGAENNTVANNNASGNEVGIRLRSSHHVGPVTNNRFIDNTAINNDVWDFISTNRTTGNRHMNLFIGDSVNPTTITFNRSKDIALRSVTNPPADPPNKRNIGHYVNGTNTSQDSHIFLNISYTDSEVTSAGVAESTLRMFRHLGSWSKVQGTNDVNTAENYVFANITSFETAPEVFAPLGNESEGTPTPTPTPTPEPSREKFVYSSKFVCGSIPDSALDADHNLASVENETPVKPGNYATAINIHNFQDKVVVLTLQAAAATRIGSDPGTVSRSKRFRLRANHAAEVDCADIAALFNGTEDEDAEFLKGFVRLETTDRVEMVGVYTSEKIGHTTTEEVDISLSTGYDQNTDTLILAGQRDDDWDIVDAPRERLLGPAIVWDRSSTFSNARWISLDEAGGTRWVHPRRPQQFVYFNGFRIPEDCTDRELTLRYLADTTGDLYLNGHLLASGANATTPTKVSTSNASVFTDGFNNLTVLVTDTDGEVTGMNLEGSVTCTRAETSAGVGMSMDVEKIEPNVITRESDDPEDEHEKEERGVESGSKRSVWFVLAMAGIAGAAIVMGFRRRNEF